MKHWIKNLRPTKSYIRETLFNIIEARKCKSSLELFAGSAILSFEALSRGIDQITVIEKDKNLVAKIKSNLKALNANFSEISSLNACSFIKNNTLSNYDLIFLDPPYNSGLLERTLTLLKDHKFLQNNKYLFYERSKNDKEDYFKLISGTHVVIKDLSIGDVSYTISKRRSL